MAMEYARPMTTVCAIRITQATSAILQSVSTYRPGMNRFAPGMVIVPHLILAFVEMGIPEKIVLYLQQ